MSEFYLFFLVKYIRVNWYVFLRSMKEALFRKVKGIYEWIDMYFFIPWKKLYLGKFEVNDSCKVNIIA